MNVFRFEVVGIAVAHCFFLVRYIIRNRYFVFTIHWMSIEYGVSGIWWLYALEFGISDGEIENGKTTVVI